MNTEFARRQMVDQQVRTWDVTSPEVLDVLNEIAREQYVPAGFEQVAYMDSEIPLPHGQVMLRPNMDGRILQALALTAGDRVLDVGTGSGYLAACMARLGAEVVTIDIYEEFVTAASERFVEDRLSNVRLESMDATAALPDGDFDAIAITGSMPELDERFVNALRPGGRLFAIVGESPVMSALRVTRNLDGIDREVLFETDIPALVNATASSEFSF